MGKFKQIITRVRVIILLMFLLLAVVAIHPNPSAEGVAIRSVAMNSSAAAAGILSPKPTAPPMSRERIVSINSEEVKNMEDYLRMLSGMQPNRTYTIKTNKESYLLKTNYETETIVLNETEFKTFEVTEEQEVNGTLVNITKNVTKLVNKTRTEILGLEPIGLTVYDAPKTNIRKGLDLQGGTRVLLQPEEEITDEEMDILIANMDERLNVYGLSDIVLRRSTDLSGNQYILVEVAGVNEAEVKELVSKQGKFEAKIANKTVFRGGGDITHVCRTAQCSGIDPTKGCGQTAEGGWACRFRFSITMTPEAAERQAEATKDLEIVREGDYEYLSEKIFFYLDDAEVDKLNIGSDLKGRPATDIQISGTGAGATQQEAIFDALKNMKRLQTILITGSLPVKLDIVQTENLSPLLGEEFVKNALFVGIVAIIAVSIVVLLRYRKLSIAGPLLFTSVSEVIMLLGFAALVGWNLDLAAIAGVIIAVGTGVDHQIVITDEVLAKEEEYSANWKQKIKKAFSIILVAYFTTVVAMIPLLFAGAGLLKGFALTTITGFTIGVFITRPAYAAVVEILLKE
ncbi:hypothetical protein JW707_00675 [Candidatus Woesearchaeota archaeon]|nr:hypothetical protein [Candidatus Woesearchaeota archaeon]